MPRRYEGRDVLWWMHNSGVWGQRYDELDDLTRARRLPSPQLAGARHPGPERADLAGRRAGRAAARRSATARALFSGGLRNVAALADLKMNRLLDTFDEWAGTATGERFPPTRVPGTARWRLDLGSGEIRSIVWATGFRPDYSWLDVPVVDPKGSLVHDGGVLGDGLYALGLPVLRRRRSTFICGIEDDAREVVDHLRAAPGGLAAPERQRPHGPPPGRLPVGVTSGEGIVAGPRARRAGFLAAGGGDHRG